MNEKKAMQLYYEWFREVADPETSGALHFIRWVYAEGLAIKGKRKILHVYQLSPSDMKKFKAGKMPKGYSPENRNKVISE